MDSRMMVEVQGLFGQYYPAVVTGFCDNDCVNLVIGQCDEVKRVHLANTRLPPATRLSPSLNFSAGDSVDALCKLPEDLISAASANELELVATLKNEAAFGEAWWPAKVREVKGSFAVVLLSLRLALPSDTVVQQRPEVVEVDKLRPANSHSSLSGKSVHRFSIPLGSDEILDFCATTQQDLNKDLRERCGGPLLISYNREAKSIDFTSLSDRAIRKVEMLADTHERRIRELFRIDEQTKRMFRISLNPSANSAYVEEFVVAQSVLNAAMQNLHKARKLDGITCVEFDKETGRFRVGGDRQEAVRDARNLLEFVEVTIGVPETYASRIIGRLGANIQRIVDKSNVLRVSVLGEADRASSDNHTAVVNSGEVPFRFMGSREAIENARMMLEYRIETLREFDRLRAGLASGASPSLSQQIADANGAVPNGEPSSSTSGFNTGGSTASVNTVGRSAHNSSSVERERDFDGPMKPVSYGRSTGYADVDGGGAFSDAGSMRRHGNNSHRNPSRSRNQPAPAHRSGPPRRMEYNGEPTVRTRRNTAKLMGIRGESEVTGYDTDSAVQVGRRQFSLVRDSQSGHNLANAVHITDIDISATAETNSPSVSKPQYDGPRQAPRGQDGNGMQANGYSDSAHASVKNGEVAANSENDFSGDPQPPRRPAGGYANATNGRRRRRPPADANGGENRATATETQ